MAGRWATREQPRGRRPNMVRGFAARRRLRSSGTEPRDRDRGRRTRLPSSAEGFPSADVPFARQHQVLRSGSVQERYTARGEGLQALIQGHRGTLAERPTTEQREGTEAKCLTPHLGETGLQQQGVELAD